MRERANGVRCYLLEMEEEKKKKKNKKEKEKKRKKIWDGGGIFVANGN